MKRRQEKIPVAILGATGMVGQKFIECLQGHPWFEIAALGASERSSGRVYSEACDWRMATPLAPRIAQMQVRLCTPQACSVPLAFSALDADVAGNIELSFAQSGTHVVSNAKNHRMVVDVPLLIPEVNRGHLDLLRRQSTPGKILTNSNCCVAGLAVALAPLVAGWGVEQVRVVTMQAVSGAGYPGVASFDILDNVIPHIRGEEEKIETELRKIFGSLDASGVALHPMQIGAQCHRVPVMDGHLAAVSVKLCTKATREEIISAWRSPAAPQVAELPSSPQHPIVYFDDPRFPQPKLHRDLGKGMSVSIGGLRPHPIDDWKFTVLSHNTVRGAAGVAVLNAELLVASGWLS